MKKYLLVWIVASILSSSAWALDSLAVVPLQLQFSSDTAQVSQTFSIINTGNDSLTWTAAAGAGSPWISVSPAGAKIGPGFSLVTVTVDRAALAPGVQSGSVDISGDGQDTTLIVNVEVAGLNLSTNLLNFGSVDTLRAVTITNSGAGVLTWEAAANQPWITASPDTGATRSSLLNVTVDRSLLPPGPASGSVFLTSNGGRDTITVNVDVAGLSVTPGTLDFGSISTSKSLTIANSGSGVLNWQAAASQTWLSVSPSSGSGGAVVTASVNRSGLAPGVHLETITVSSNGGTVVIPVRVAVADLNVFPQVLNFGPQDSSLTLSVANGGSDTLQFSLQDDQTWLELGVSGGLVTTDTALVPVTVNRDSVLPGAYQGNIFVDSNGGRDTVSVLMAFAGLIISPGSLSFSSAASDTVRSFAIQNNGSGNLSWSVSADSAWATAIPASGITPGFSIDSVRVRIDRTQLGPGTHQAQITINDQTNNRQIFLLLTVEVAALQVAPQTLTFSSNPSDVSRNIGIGNIGGGQLNWQVQENIPWLSAAPASGSTGGGTTDSVTISIDRSQLPQGLSSDTLQVADLTNGVLLPVTVNVQVSGLTLNTDSLQFSSDPADTIRAFQISNNGLGQLEWTAQANQPWLSLSPASDSTGGGETDTVMVQVDRAVLPNGLSTANILVQDLTNNVTSQIVVVVLKGGLAVQPASLIFSSDPLDTLQVLTIQANGAADLRWNVRSDSTWLSFSPPSGMGSGAVNVVLDRSTLVPQQAPYLDTVTVADLTNGVTLQVPVRVDLNLFAVSTDSLHFSSQPDSIFKEFRVSKSGSGQLFWQASDNQDWLFVSPSSGELNDNRFADTLTVIINRSGLVPEGSPHRAQINIRDITNNVRRSVAVAVDVSGLGLSSDTLLFTSNPADTAQALVVENRGSGEMLWSVQTSTIPGWANLSQTSGNGTTAITVAVDRDALGPGQHQAFLRFDDLTNSDTRSLALIVNKTDLALSDTLIDLGSNVDVVSGRFQINSTGSGALNWRLQPDSAWLSVAPLQGTGSDTVEFTVDRAALSPQGAPYSSRIVVIDETNLDTQQVRIKVDVAALSLSPSSLLFRSDSAGAPPDSFLIINAGSGILSWVAVPDTNWLAVSPSTGDRDTTIQVTVLDNLLDPGFHRAWVRVEDITNHARDTVWVEVEKLGAALSEQRLDFDSDIDTLSFSIQNTGAGLLHWQILPIMLDTVWFDLSASSGNISASQSQSVVVSVYRERVNEFRNYAYPLRIATDAGTFIVDINMDVDQLEITHDGSQLGTILAGSAATITATISDSGATFLAQLQYRVGSETAFTVVPMNSSDGLLYQGQIPGNAVTAAGVEYFIVAENRYQKVTRSSTFSFPVRTSAGGISRSELQPAGSYRLVSLPLNLDNKDARAVMQQSFGVFDPAEWRFFQLTANGYADIDTSDILIRPGEAYWLIVRDPQAALSSGAGESILLDRPFTLPLRPGFNFVANPYAFPVAAGQLQLASGNPLRLYFWEDAWFLSDSSGVIQTGSQTLTGMAPFQGFALANTRFEVNSQGDTTLVPDTLIITPRAAGQTRQLTKISSPAGSAWQIQLTARNSVLRDEQNYLGAALNSSDAFDVGDQPEPPYVGEFLSVYFTHPGWPRPLHRLTSDQRGFAAAGHRWDMEVVASLPEPVQLEFSGLAQLPERYRAILADRRSGEVFDLAEAERVTIPYIDPHRPYPLAVVIGSEAFVEGQIAELNLLPTEYVLFQNYPNPFNPATTIRFGLPEAQKVSVAIYNLLGQRVRSLLRDEPFEAGYHARRWDGRNESGARVASGVYFFRIRAGKFVSSKKMLLIR